MKKRGEMLGSGIHHQLVKSEHSFKDLISSYTTYFVASKYICKDQQQQSCMDSKTCLPACLPDGNDFVSSHASTEFILTVCWAAAAAAGGRRRGGGGGLRRVGKEESDL